MDQRYDPAFQRGHTDERTRPNTGDIGRRSRLASLEEIAPQLIQPPTDGRPVRPPTDDRFDDGPRARPSRGMPSQADRRIHPFEARTADTTTVADQPGSAGPDAQQTQLDQQRYEEYLDAADAHRVRAVVWERVLWIVGVVFTLGGGVGLWQSFTLLYRGFVGDSGPTDNYLWMQFLGALAPTLITIGLATIVALLFKRMLDHDRRSRP
ncbi:hypothetical protein A4X17_14425 [Plantibacter sp. H53]|uniref:hypothetical protein n=1 Tax=Plantibacter sp. H53 TaxID=1827323 RepID=UPI0007D90227|nr:hypothetical protein [Plantibacter sp. H53]OAN33818.1 hypothetical protein A4X17_14425 [Plantibacter sp. H53]